ncbi:MAG: hypothetical protein PGMFKBFP_02397 [Anaerolineales bacterium]|nr:hypothetical protein [Anaerolineales bacterium]
MYSQYVSLPQPSVTVHLILCVPYGNCGAMPGVPSTFDGVGICAKVFHWTLAVRAVPDTDWWFAQR